MKITREQIKQIIQEELDKEERKVLQEGPATMDMVKFPALLKKIIPLLQQTFGQDINVYQFLIDMAEFYAKDPDFYDQRPQYTDDLASDLGLRETEDDYDRFKNVPGYEDERVPGKTASQVRRRNLPPEEPKAHYADDLHLYLEKDKNDRRDAGQRNDLPVERQREICRSRSRRGERVHFNEKTKRCEYDYPDEE